MMRRVGRRGIAVLCTAVVVIALVAGYLGFVSRPAWPDGAIFVMNPDALPTVLRDAEPDAFIVLRGDREWHGPLSVNVSGLTLVAEDKAQLTSVGEKPTISVEADGVSLRGLDISGDSIGVLLASSGCTVEDVAVSDTPIGIQIRGGRSHVLREVTISGAVVGLEISASGGHLIADLGIRDTSECGVHLTEAWANRMERIEVRGTPTGVSIDRGSSENELVDARVTGASVSGIEARSSSGNQVRGAILTDCRIGVLLDVVTEHVIEATSIEGATDRGIVLQRSARNQLTGNEIRACLGGGIALTQSSENALVDNRVTASGDVGIHLEGSDTCLLLVNSIRDAHIGILSEGSNRLRISRNTVTDPSISGILVREGSGNRVTDTRITGGTTGIVLVKTPDAMVHRNRMTGQSGAALVAVGEDAAMRLTDNTMEEAAIGCLVYGSGEIWLRGNQILRGDTGILLVGTAAMTRIDGNQVGKNHTGVAIDAAVRGAAWLAPLGIERLDGTPLAGPIIHNNTFEDNESYDVENRTNVPVTVGNNWWGGGETHGDLARLSQGVGIAESAWKGIASIGTGATPSQIVLGTILRQCLEEAGYRVIDLIGLGSDDRLLEALERQDVHLAWWGAEAQAAVDGTESIRTTAVQSWAGVGAPGLVERLSGPLLSALGSHVFEAQTPVRWAVPRSYGTEAFDGLLAAYGMDASMASVTWTESLEETEALLKFGLSEIAIVEALQESLTASDFVLLTDDRSAFPTRPVVVSVQSDLLADHPDIRALLDRLVGQITTDALHSLVSRVRLLDQSPEDVAREFLQRIDLGTE